MSSKNLKKVRKSLPIKRENKKTFSWPVVIGIALILTAFLIPARTFAPVIRSEFEYQINKKNVEPVVLNPVDTDFSIVIPKINANTKVVKNVDPYNSAVYQKALTQGVAHASTSTTPDKNGNVFIFAHSAGNWYQANQYNAVFYLLNKLNKDDEISIYYQNKKYTYLVKETKFVKPDEISYLSNNLLTNQLTLMTCWPPGTTLKRLIIIAELQNVN